MHSPLSQIPSSAHLPNIIKVCQQEIKVMAITKKCHFSPNKLKNYTCPSMKMMITIAKITKQLIYYCKQTIYATDQNNNLPDERCNKSNREISLKARKEYLKATKSSKFVHHVHQPALKCNIIICTVSESYHSSRNTTTV